MDVFSKCRVVLIRTSHPGNIGAVARAVKTMGLGRLYLVSPKQFPSEEATLRASHATDILENAVVCQTLSEALAGTVAAYGLSARLRDLSASPQSVADAARQAVGLAATQGEIAFVFGNETTGITNDEMRLCNRFAYIPTSDDYYSLNLGSAVQVVAYEYRMAAMTQAMMPEKTETLMATHQEYEGFYAHLEAVLSRTKFLESGNSTRILRRLRRLFDRATLEQKEIMILRGILTSLERAMTERKDSSA